MSEARGTISAADLNGWVDATFEFDSPGSPQERRRAMLDKLNEADLLPPDEWRSAMIYGMRVSYPNNGTADGHADQHNGSLASVPATESGAAVEVYGHKLPRDVLDYKEKAVREEVNALAAGFFALSPEQRAERIRKLQKDSTVFCPQSNVRLEQLNKAAHAQLRLDQASADVSHLAQATAQLFTCHPAKRGELRRKIFSRMGADPRRWTITSELVTRDFPEVSRLAPKFLANVRSMTKPRSIGSLVRMGPQNPRHSYEEVPGRNKESATIIFSVMLVTVVVVIAVLSIPELAKNNLGMPQGSPAYVSPVSPNNNSTPNYQRPPNYYSGQPYGGSPYGPGSNSGTGSRWPSQPQVYPPGSRQYPPSYKRGPDPIQRSRPRPPGQGAPGGAGFGGSSFGGSSFGGSSFGGGSFGGSFGG